MARERVRLGANYRKLYWATALSNIGDGMSAIAYPWLATAITRNPMLVALVAAAQRLPWLVFTLPAGVITDRVDRKRAMVSMDSLRFVFTLLIAIAVFFEQDSLPAPDEVKNVVGTRTGLYVLLLIATLLLGCAEVLARQLRPDVHAVHRDPEHLERANGRMWSIESVANTFIGPPLGSLLLLVAFSAPFFVDAGSFFAAAALVAAIPGVVPRRAPRRRGGPAAVEDRAGGGGRAGCGATRCCARWPSSSALMNMASQPQRRDVRAVLPGRARRDAAHVHDHGLRLRRRRHHRRLRRAVAVEAAGQRHVPGADARVGSASPSSWSACRRRWPLTASSSRSARCWAPPGTSSRSASARPSSRRTCSAG